MNKRTKDDLRQMQSIPLAGKIIMTQRRIREWYEAWDGQVYVSFSGGKDSTVLLHIVREMYPDVEAVFVNTGLEYPEIQKFVKTFDNVTIIRPKMRFDEVIKMHGYPVIGKRQAEAIRKARKNLKDGVYTSRLALLGMSREEAYEIGLRLPDPELLDRYEKTVKDSKFAIPKYRPLLDTDFECSEQCCDVMKKSPAKAFQKATGKKPIIATMADESANRESAWLKTGCNAFGSGDPKSTPMAFWTEQDVLRFIKERNIPIPSVYGDIVEIGEDGLEYEGNLTGCVVGKLKTTGCDRTGCIFCGFGCHIEKDPRFQRLKQTHPRQYEYCIGGGEYDEDGIWKPNKEGLGMGHIFDELNKIYGDDFIRYGE